MGLFGGGNSTTQLTDLTTNNDDRVGASDQGTVVQVGAGGSFSFAPVTTTTDARSSTTITNTNTQTVDPGLLRTAREIAGLATAGAVAQVDGANHLAETALNTSSASVQAALKNASDADRHLSDIAGTSIAAVRGSLTDALSNGLSVTRSSLDFSGAVAGQAIDSLGTDNIRAFNFASDLFDKALGTVTDSQRQTALQADNFVSDFTSQLATANESQSERNFGRVQQLAVVAVIVIVVGLAVAKG
jgi:hypothetical protein